jgi:hypothetical protein
VSKTGGTSFFDSLGTAPGDQFDDIDAAAINAIKYIFSIPNPEDPSKGKRPADMYEYGTAIYRRNDNGKYAYLEPSLGSEGIWALPESQYVNPLRASPRLWAKVPGESKGQLIIAVLHTHRRWEATASKDDEQCQKDALKYKFDIYIGNAHGDINRFHWQTQEWKFIRKAR